MSTCSDHSVRGPHGQKSQVGECSNVCEADKCCADEEGESYDHSGGECEHKDGRENAAIQNVSPPHDNSQTAAENEVKTSVTDNLPSDVNDVQNNTKEDVERSANE